MQIHEVTKPQLDEGIASALGSIVGGARAGLASAGQALTGGGAFSAAMKDPMRQQQLKMLANKSYDAWKAYEKTLLQSNPDARQTPMYQQALLAFVTKNLLGGQYLPNVINKQQIQALVKQLSQPGATAKTQPATNTTPTANNPAKSAPGVMPASVAGSAQGQRMQQAYGQPRGGIEGMQSDLEEASLPDAIKGNVQQWKDTYNKLKPAAKPAPTAGTSLGAKEIPGKSALLKGKAQPRQPQFAPTPQSQTATPPNPAALSTQQEKDLWFKLIQQAAVATTTAPGTGSTKAADDELLGSSEAGDARSYAQEFGDYLKPEEVTALKKFASGSVSKFGSQQVKSTGNPVADAMLLLSGFRGI
jgi:hypothetical protein